MSINTLIAHSISPQLVRVPLILYYKMELMELPAVRKDMEDEGWSEEDVDNNIVKRLNHNMVGACSRLDMCSCMK